MFNLKLIHFCLVILWNLDSATFFYLPPKSHSPIHKSKEYDDNAGHLSTLDFKKLPYFVSDEKLTWFEALTACSNRGLNLMFPQNFYESSLMRIYISVAHLPSDKYSGYWIGGIRKTDTDDFFWLDGKPIDKNGWLLGEPNGFSGENCIELKKKSYDNEVGWNNLYCHDLRRYICHGRTTDEVYKGEGKLISRLKLNEVEKNISEMPLLYTLDLNNITSSTTLKSTTIITSSTTARTIPTSKATTLIATTNTSMAIPITDSPIIIPTEYTIATTTINPPRSSSQTPVNFVFPSIRTMSHHRDTFRKLYPSSDYHYFHSYFAHHF
ncbi:uncharacterized protein [Euwallacea similis]|uniref:uncharacterized protein n=1 Tax=Euwallacea similis TaxID=1736056 RepID=UPI00344EFFE5